MKHCENSYLLTTGRANATGNFWLDAPSPNRNADAFTGFSLDAKMRVRSFADFPAKPSSDFGSPMRFNRPT